MLPVRSATTTTTCRHGDDRTSKPSNLGLSRHRSPRASCAATRLVWSGSLVALLTFAGITAASAQTAARELQIALKFTFNQTRTNGLFTASPREATIVVRGDRIDFFVRPMGFTRTYQADVPVSDGIRQELWRVTSNSVVRQIRLGNRVETWTVRTGRISERLTPCRLSMTIRKNDPSQPFQSASRPGLTFSALSYSNTACTIRTAS